MCAKPHTTGYNHMLMLITSGSLASALFLNVNGIVFYLTGMLGVATNALGVLSCVVIVLILFGDGPRLSRASSYLVWFAMAYMLIGSLSGLSRAESIVDFDSHLKSLVITISTLVVFSSVGLSSIKRDRWQSFVTCLSVVHFLGLLSIPVFYLMGLEVAYLFISVGQISEIGRASGIFGNANGAAANCCIGVLLVQFSYLRQGTAMSKVGLLAAMGLMFYCLYLTGSLTGMFLGLLISILFLSVGVVDRKERHKFVAAFTVAACFIVSAALVGWDAYARGQTDYRLSRIGNLFSDVQGTEGDKYSSRGVLVQEGLSLASDRPAFGWGLGSFARNVIDDQGVHNFYVQMLGEGGVVLLLMYLAFLATLLRLGLRQPRRDLQFLALGYWAIIVVLGLTSHDIFFSRIVVVWYAVLSCAFDPTFASGKCVRG